MHRPRRLDHQQTAAKDTTGPSIEPRSEDLLSPREQRPLGSLRAHVLDLHVVLHAIPTREKRAPLPPLSTQTSDSDPDK